MAHAPVSIAVSTIKNGHEQAVAWKLLRQASLNYRVNCANYGEMKNHENNVLLPWVSPKANAK